MNTLILAAGYATRLWPLTLDVPKPLLSVKNKPIINYSINKITSAKPQKKIYVVTNTKFVSSFEKWAAEHKAKNKIIVIDDFR